MRVITLLLVCFPVLLYAQHPVAFSTPSGFASVKSSISKFPVLRNSFNQVKRSVDMWIGKDVDVPFPKDPAGGYTHDRHKENYTLMFHAGLLYNITGESKYAELVKSVLMKYAALNPTLQNHPQATSSSPGRIFWQALNDANWLVYAGLAYDMIYNYLAPGDRKTIEEGAFKPEVDFITTDLESWFNLVHNHGVWASAGVGIVGIATNNEAYLKKALYGTKGDGNAGFLAQLDQLFSPDGYYTEGPYYVRYALLPFYVFANALHHARPGLKIFQYRDQILKKALASGLQQTNINGRFFPMNDALKEKDFTTNELVTAVGIAWDVYGKDNGLLSVAQRQGRVLLHRGGASIAAEMAKNRNIPSYYNYSSVEYSDGPKGDQGGISLLRSGSGAGLTTLIFKYAAHGLSHGHYDKLGLNLFDQGNEVLQDYGAVRFIGVEQKYGGRYLPENKSFAAQTIAHNTLVVDEQSHFNGREAQAEKHHSEKLFSSIGGKSVQVVSAKEENAYPGVKMFRTVYLLKLPGFNKPFVIDIFRTASESVHQFDLPFQYNGAVIKTSFSYQPFTQTLNVMGKRNGYQFLWKEAEGAVSDTITQFTFLNGNSYYTISSLVTDSAHIYFTRSGAGDPNFNIRREPSYIIRKKGKDQSFLSVIEIHGNFDPVAEFSTNSYPSVEGMRLLRNDSTYTVAEITIRGRKLLIAQSNQDFSMQSAHQVNQQDISIRWTGAYAVLYDGKQLN